MPNLLATASQVANSLSNLKAKYIKYLESLCSANGIDISTLKTEGQAHTILEMYFGGLPVLVGLKYFSNISTLRLFGQQITCLKPLAEVAPTLEELWVCEGAIKDLTGVEHCIRLKKLFLYENLIEDASCLASLTSLQVLDLSSNKLKNLAFIRYFKDLTNFSIANNKMRDSVIATVFWPENVQYLDISANCFSSNKALFPLRIMSSLRSLQIDPVTSPTTVSPNIFFAWIAHSFRFIESIDNDKVSEVFVTINRPSVDLIFAEKAASLAKIDEKYFKDLRLAEKHSGKIEVRLGCLSEALANCRDMIQTKDAKKEIVKRVYEICTTNSKAVKNIRKNYTLLSDYIRALSKYRIACELESCETFTLRDSTPEETAFISQTINYSCSMKHCYEIIIKSCTMLWDVVKTDADRLFILEKDCHDSLFDIRSIIHLLDRFTRSNYMKTGVKLVRDFEIIKKQAKEKTTIFFIPLVLSKMSTSRNGGVSSGVSRISEEDGMNSISNDSSTWSDIRLVAVAAVEIQPVGQLTTDQLRFMDKFEESWMEQLKKLNEMNIKLDIKEERQKKPEETTEASIDSINNATSKIRKVSDILANVSLLTGRICDEKLPFDWFSTRNPLEIALAYFDCRILKDSSEMAMRITVIDLSDQKLTKLAGIQELVSLQCLSLRKNKIGSLKKLLKLPTLKFLDASNNHIAKIEHLPSTLIDVDLSFNRIQTLGFCQSLQNCRHLRLQRNQVKSLKGLESCVQLETLCISDNVIKEKIELDVFKTLTKLTHLDMTSNIVSSTDGFRSKMMQFVPFLISLDRQMIPVEERAVSTSKQATRGLSLELIEKICPQWQSKQELMIFDQKIEQIILDKSQLEEISHVRLIDLSNNKLSCVREISSLNITHLVLNNNVIKSIAVSEGQLQPFQNLENLDLSSNSISNQNIGRLGIQLLQKLKQIDLSYNALTKFDCTIFDIPKLESIDLSNNAIKAIVRKILRSLTTLKLQNNRLTTLSPLFCPNLVFLDVSNNKLSSCASLKPLCEFKFLETLNCRSNTVTERRVYVDFIKSQVTSVKKLDDEVMCSEVDVTKRRLSRANDIVSMSRRNSMVTSSMLSWFEKEEEETLDSMKRTTSFLDIPPGPELPVSKSPPRRLEPIRGRRAIHDDSGGFMLFGKKAIQHKKL